ncbi:MAG: methyltransferase domain-containing protein [Clostridia bacterium]|nr:methyltransferase domain-containing protein [Clostridia bacterium]
MVQNAKKKSRDYFNSHRKSRLAYGGYWKHDYRFQLEAIGRIMPDRLIDIGCGPGAFLSMVEETFPDIQLNALDLSEGMIRETRERLSSTAIATVGDSEKMPLESEQYQVVTCNMSIHHYPHPQNAVNEMFRILKPGGVLLLNDMDCIAPIRAVANWLFPKLPGGDVKMYSREETEGMVRSAGFQKIQYRKISPFSFQCIVEKAR